MDAEHAMRELPQIVESLQSRLAALYGTVNEITEQWQQLGRMGAQRCDHAADLLTKLSGPLHALSTFAQTRLVEVRILAAIESESWAALHHLAAELADLAQRGAKGWTDSRSRVTSG